MSEARPTSAYPEARKRRGLPSPPAVTSTSVEAPTIASTGKGFSIYPRGAPSGPSSVSMGGGCGRRIEDTHKRPALASEDCGGEVRGWKIVLKERLGIQSGWLQ